MITTYKVFEGKQVGILYHWTDLDSLKGILKDDKMGSWRGYISFSRNKNLNYNARPVKITFDGDKMSHHFKFEPYLYDKSFHFKEEAEERIKCNFKDDEFEDNPFLKSQKNNCIKGIKKYIIGIEINFSDIFSKRDFEEDLEEYKKLTNVEIKNDLDELKKDGWPFYDKEKSFKFLKNEMELKEGKQVGILYHWTDDLESLERILETDSMWSSYGYISFSRNKNLNYLKRCVKITFDGDKMSNHFKFEPHLFKGNLRYKKEAEERIECKLSEFNRNDKIQGVKKYITDIEIQHNPYNFTDELIQKVNEVQKLIPNVKIRTPKLSEWMLEM